MMTSGSLTKQKELERQIRVLVQERKELHRQVLSKGEELKKIDSRLQQSFKDRTSLTSDLAAMEKELADLRRGNKVLKTKVQEFSTDRKQRLQAELALLQGKLKKQEKEMSDIHDKLRHEAEEKSSAIRVLKQANTKLDIMTVNKEKVQKLYEKTVKALKMEKGRYEEIQSTTKGLLSERSSLETELRNEKELTTGLQGQIRCTEMRILQLSETILSMEKQICCSNGEKEGLLRQNIQLERKLKNATEEQSRLEVKLKQFEALSEIIQLKDATYQQLEEERNELAIKLEAVEGERELGQKHIDESCEKLKNLQLRYELIELRLSEVNQEAKAAREKLVEELNEAKSFVSSQQSQLDDCKARMTAFERQVMCLEKQLNSCHAEKDQLQQLKDQLDLRLVECRAVVCSLEEVSQRSSAELGEARAQMRNVEEERKGILLEMKNHEEAKAMAAAAELTQATKQLEEFKKRAAVTQEQLSQVLSERDQLVEDNQKMKKEFEEELDQSIGYEEQLAKYEQEVEKMKEKLSLDAEKIRSLEMAESLLRGNMDRKYRGFEETLVVLSQQKAELESSVKTLKTELSESQESLAFMKELLHDRESGYVVLSHELESLKAEQEEAENLVSRLQREVQTVRLRREQAEYARTELEAAKAYVEKDLSEVKKRLKEMCEEMEKVQHCSDEVKVRKEELSGWITSGEHFKKPDSGTSCIEVPSFCVGKIVGKHGSMIKDLQVSSNTKIKIVPGRPGLTTRISITGRCGAKRRAEELIEDLIANCHDFSKCGEESTSKRGASDACGSNYSRNGQDNGLSGSFVWDRIKGTDAEFVKSTWKDYPPVRKDFYFEDAGVVNLEPHEVERIRRDNNNIMVQRLGGNDEHIPNPIRTFREAFGRYPEIMDELQKVGFEKPSPIQMQAWPIILKGQDLIGIAQTGTGKTLAFLLPAFIHIEGQPVDRKNRGGANVLVLTPSREFALQIEEEVKKYKYKDIKCVCVYGGGCLKEQLGVIESGVDIIVATPGRLSDVINSKFVDMKSVTYLVLDEADRLLGEEFQRDIRKILLDIRPDRQTIVTSATWPVSVRYLATSYMSNPVQVFVGSMDLTACHSVLQRVVIVEEDRKYEKLTSLLEREISENDKVIVFIDRKAVIDYTAAQFVLNRIDCHSIHGGQEQIDREQALEDFKNGSGRIFLTTDVASRRLDLKVVTHVINYDFPRNLEDYVHRVCRMGRVVRRSQSITFMTRNDWRYAQELIQIMEGTDQEVPEELYEMAVQFAANQERKMAVQFTANRERKKQRAAARGLRSGGYNR